MRITIEEDASLTEAEVVIRCTEVNDDVLRLIGAVELLDQRLVGFEDGKRLVLSAKDVLYFESVDAHTYAYLPNSVVEVPFRLYELKERLGTMGFEHASKSCIVNLNRIVRMAPYVGGRLIATLDNGEDLVVSRKYAPKIKKRIGL